MNTYKDASTDTGPSGTGKRMDGDRSPRIECVCGNHKFSMSIIDIKPGSTKNILYEYQPIYVCTECNRIYTMSEWSDMTLQAVKGYLEVNE